MEGLLIGFLLVAILVKTSFHGTNPILFAVDICLVIMIGGCVSSC